MNKELGGYRFGIVIDLYYLCNVVGEGTASFGFGFSSPCLRRHKDASLMQTSNKTKANT